MTESQDDSPTIGGVLARSRERSGPAFDAPGRATAYSHREFATSVWKGANLLRHYGVRSGARVAVVVGPSQPSTDDEPGRLGATPEPLLAALGGTLLGGVVNLQPSRRVEGRALIAPAAWLDRIEAAPGCTRVAYGGPPDEPDVVHFERERWSENPVEPPESVQPDAVAIDDGREYTHRELVHAAREVVGDYGLEAGDRVAVRAPLATGVLVAGVLAPLAAGATIVGGTSTADGAGGDPDADLVVGEGGDVDPRSISDSLDTRRT